MKAVAVTGILSCGKSTVCRLLKELGAEVVSADKIVHELYASDASLRNGMINLFGPSVIKNGGVDRDMIAREVFRDAAKLATLERLVHPAVLAAIESKRAEANARSPQPELFVAEVPLLFETGLDSGFDLTVTVVANEAKCKERFQLATGANEQEFNRRMARQLSQSEKAARADLTLVNEGDLQALTAAVSDLFTKLKTSTQIKKGAQNLK